MRRFYLAGGQVLLLAVLLWVGAYLLVSLPPVLHLYRLSFRKAVGHRFAGQMARVKSASRPTVLFLGPSSVREALDEEVMAGAAPRYRFLNGGTSGGSVFLNELLVTLLRQYRVRPDCIVLGLNARMMMDRNLALDAHGYTDFMDRWHGWELVGRQMPGLREAAYRNVLANSVVPLRRLSRQISMLLRYGLYRLQDRYPLVARRPVGDFELKGRELAPFPSHLYTDTRPADEYLEKMFEHWREKGLFDRKNYARKRHRLSLQETLDDCLEITPNVIVVIMPEHSRLRGSFGAYAVGPMESILSRYKKKGCLVVDRSDSLPDDALRDGGHLLPHGREEFSRDMARTVSRYLKDRKVR